MRKQLFFLCLGIISFCSHAQELFEMRSAQSRWSSFENFNGVRGSGGKTNKTAKGNAFEFVEPGETKLLLNISEAGSIRRIWLTIDQNPVKLRSLRLQMFWDASAKPAVDVPLGDFFVYNLGKGVPFESALFSSGEGRSFNCYIPMPFRKGARIQVVNEGAERAKLFYDINFLLHTVPVSALYFHAYWSRKSDLPLGEDFTVLPKISGKGRFLGMSVGLITDSVYGKTWWGEGEVKMFLDNDTKYPTIVGTGAEDYIGSAWGLGSFVNQYQGCTIANDSARRYNFYRWHIPDPLFFHKNIMVTLQQIGGGMKSMVRDLVANNVKLTPISIDGPAGFVRLLDLQTPIHINDPGFADGWVNFYRVDDYSAVAYFYLDRPASTLPGLADVGLRIRGITRF